MGESISWTPRSMKSAQGRSDQNGRGMGFTYDSADRLTQVNREKAAEGVQMAFAHLPSHWGYSFDAAQNLVSINQEQGCDTDTVDLPPDGSGRNRPGKIGNTALDWNEAGNMIEKGDRSYFYDFRNRLINVKEGEAFIVRYEYDAFDRRVRKEVGGEITETVWAGSQPIEEYRNDSLYSLRVYGLGLDEIISLEIDVNGDHSFSESEQYIPHYDSIGNLAVLTWADGDIIEKYEYTPFGERWSVVDNTPPVIESVVQVGGEIWIEVSEEVMLAKVEQAISEGDLTLIRQTDEGPVTVPLAASQPITEGRGAGKRLVLHPTADEPEAEESVALYLATGILVDGFHNVSADGIDENLTWHASWQVVSDTALPRVERVCITESGKLSITFSEPVNVASEALLLNGALVTWTQESDGYTITSGVLPIGGHELLITTDPLDPVDQGLEEIFSQSFLVDVEPRQMLFDAPYPGVSRASTVGNPFGFHGLYHDGETELVYARARYLDPEMGRFISTDPMGYLDGPNLYQYALNNTANFSDPTGESVTLAVVGTLALAGVISVGVGAGSEYAISNSKWGDGTFDYSFADAGVDFVLGAATAGISNYYKAGRFGLTGARLWAARIGTEAALDVSGAYARAGLKGESLTTEQALTGAAANFAIGEAGAWGARRFGRLWRGGMADSSPSVSAVSEPGAVRARLWNQHKARHFSDNWDSLSVADRKAAMQNFLTRNRWRWGNPIGKRGFRKWSRGVDKIEGHHSFPKYLGGDPNQKLTDMTRFEHNRLHKDMNEFLANRGMAHKSGYGGFQIRRTFGRKAVVEALSEFYRGPGAKYSNAAQDFLKYN